MSSLTAKCSRILSVTCLATLMFAGPVSVAMADKDVTLRFSWKLKGEYAPLYVALDKGYFKEEGLNVTLAEGNGSQSALAAVAQGQEHATWLPGVFAMSAISNDFPVKLIALYSPAAPMSLVSHPDNPVHTPKDLEGKSVAHSVGETATDFMPVLCSINNVDCSKIQLVTLASGARATQFATRHVDVMGTYANNDLPILRMQENMDLVEMSLPEYGLVLPGAAIAVSERLLENDPDMLRGLLRAIARGFDDAAADPAAAAEILMKYWDTSLDPAIVTVQVEETIEWAETVEGKPWGWINPDVLTNAQQILESAERIKTDIPLDRFYTNALFE